MLFKNKKAFTLIELIVVIIILGVILTFALPNITSTLERNKKDQFIVDAKDMVEKTKNYILKNGYPSSCEEYYLDNIDVRTEIKTSPYGFSYNRTDSGVKVCLETGTYTYSVKLIDNNGNGIGKYDFVDYMKLNTQEKYALVETN